VVTAALDDRVDVVRRRVEQWADELIELGPRNTLLHYKDRKTTTLDLTGARPETLANLLAGRKTRLEALFPDGDEHRSACTRARNLRRRILVFEEEQGMDVGRLAHGLLQLEPPPRSGVTPVPPLRAPLLLQAVQLNARTASESDFTLEAADEPEVNPVLLYALSRQYGIDFDEDAIKERLSAMLATLESPQEQLRQAYQTLADVIEQHDRTVSLEDRVLVGLFSFEKLPMVNDLRTSIELLARHDVIAAAAGAQAGEEALQAQAESIPPMHPDRIPPSEEYLIHDADSSQQQAIHAALSGAHIVIEGPPGTGKSQTIANLIAELAARGRRVLFVAEKRAAIEAVTERLEQVDLHGLVFDLHQRKLNRKRTAQQLADALQRASQEPPPQLGDLHKQLAQARERASAHTAELHQPRPPWNLSAYDAQSTLLNQPCENSSGVRFRDATLRRLSGDARGQVRRDLGDFIAMDGLRIRRGDSPWSRVAAGVSRRSSRSWPA